jgi:hypothetical protein
MLALSVKQMRAMLANNPLRNSRPELIVDDGQSVLLLARSTAWLGPDQREAVSRSGFTSSNHTSDRSRLHASENAFEGALHLIPAPALPATTGTN